LTPNLMQVSASAAALAGGLDASLSVVVELELVRLGGQVRDFGYAAA